MLGRMSLGEQFLNKISNFSTSPDIALTLYCVKISILQANRLISFDLTSVNGPEKIDIATFGIAFEKSGKKFMWNNPGNYLLVKAVPFHAKNHS